MEQERKSTKPRIIELERKVEELTRKLAAAESSLALKDAELSSMHINVKEVEDLREMKEVVFFLISCLKSDTVVLFILMMSTFFLSRISIGKTSKLLPF